VNARSSHPPSLILDTVPPPGADSGGGTFLVLQSTPHRERLIATALAGTAAEFLSPESAAEVERMVALAAPDVLVLDRAMHEWAALCRLLKTGPAHSIPIVLVDWEDGGELAAVEALEAGADEFVGSPSHTHELRARIHNQLRHKRQMDTLKRLRAERDSWRFDATLDALTSVLNRKALDRALRQLEEDEAELSLVFIDVDHFKEVNDNYGHGIGDRVLAALGRLLRDHVRPNDVVGRYGGEEFVVVLRDAGTDAARRVAERIRQSISGCTIAGLSRRVTVSAGVAPRARGESISELIARADLALYAAKRAGRNRVLLAPPAGALQESFLSSPADTLVRAAARGVELEVGHSAAE
jgi:diguanylate cyclase (GGDEF)-like protein